MLPKIFFYFVISSFLFSCASGYKPILPQQMSYGKLQSEGEINYTYRYNVLTDTKNKKYANKETNKGVKLVALQIENISDQEIILREHAKFYMGDKNILVLDPRQFQQQVKQPGGLYMIWSVLFLTINRCEGFECTAIPIPLGFVIGLLNWSTASRANKNLLSELIGNNILDRRIAPGEKSTGLIGVVSDELLPLEIRIVR